MTTSNDPPFQRGEFVDKPGIVGARWWQEGLAQANPVGRRNALLTMLILGGVIAGIGAIPAVACGSSSAPPPDEFATQPRASLDMQKEYGWNFGAAEESLTFDGTSTTTFDRSTLGRLPDDLAPAEAKLRPYFVPTLFQSPSALPNSSAPGDPAQVAPLSAALHPISTASMDNAYRQGKGLASLFARRALDIALVVDLPGPEAVAFAAGAASVFEPVFTFGNWPHPRGVVPAHLTLAAAAYYQPLFARFRSERPAGAPAMFVLDRKRLAPYTDESKQFDNRHVAQLPGAPQMAALGVRHLLYVVPPGGEQLELDDLNDDFVAYVAHAIPVKIVATEAFSADPHAGVSLSSQSGDGGVDSAAPYYYGGSAETHDWFWTDYPFAVSLHNARRPLTISTIGRVYVPRPRVTPFSSGAAGGASNARPRPSGFGTVPVVIAVATGAILGAKLSRSGSWNRSSGSWGGG